MAARDSSVVRVEVVLLSLIYTRVGEGGGYSVGGEGGGEKG